MKYIELNYRKPDEGKIRLIIEQLKKGKVVGYLSDTVYGLGCCADNVEAIKKIYRIKKKPKTKPMLVLVSSINMLSKYAYISSCQRDFIKKVWPGSTTLVFRSKNNLPQELSSQDETQAFRLPKNNILCRIIRRIGVPLVSTSLNISSKNTERDPKDILNGLDEAKPDLFVDSGIARKTRSSRILDIRNINDIKILRK